MPKKKYLLVPSTERGNGTGHLVRCAALAAKLGGGSTVLVCDESDAGARGFAELSLALPELFSSVPVIHELSGKWDACILDVRTAGREFVRTFAPHGPVIGIDLEGDGRNDAYYLIDILNRTSVLSGIAPNMMDSGFLDLPQNRKDFPRSFKRILVTFGGEDPTGLTDRTVSALTKENLFDPDTINVIPGTLTGATDLLKASGVHVLDRIPNLKERFVEWDVVITQYGITAWEAAWAGCTVVLVNPSEYHAQLAKCAGFPLAGTENPDPGLVRKALERPENLEASMKALNSKERKSLSDAIKSLSFRDAGVCPVCRGSKSEVKERFAAKTYRRCSICRTVFRDDHTGKDKRYGKDYFFEEYKTQYGKTYLEDFLKISLLSGPRIDRIAKTGKFSGGESILDVGCAYGPFLAAAREKGFKPYGIDVSADAVKWVKGELNIDAQTEAFPAPDADRFGKQTFDAVTMWFVIEHFHDLDAAMKEVSVIVRKGGVFAFSTPSGEGVSARFGPRAFFDASPHDHRVVLEPSMMRRFLARYGFRIKKMVSTGHHPERASLFKARVRGFRHAIGMIASKSLGLGDTFEVYAVRE